VKTSLVVTVIGADRPGLVDRLSSAALARGANWEASRLVRLGGRFAGVFLVALDAANEAALRRDLEAIAELRVVVERSDDAPAAADVRALRLELVGDDRPGILREIAHALAERGVNVEELETWCASAPMAGGALFHLRARLHCPAAVSSETLRAVLEAIAHDLMVDLTLADA
jgi:glycine cleavage system regulatory protein